jgi:MFS family permease
LNWSYARKWSATLLVSCFTFISPVSSTMVAPALHEIADEFNIKSDIERYLVMSIFLLAYALGPFILAPLSEMYGRVVILQSANMVYLIFNTVCGFATSREQMLAFRFLSGLGGSAPQAVRMPEVPESQSALIIMPDRGRRIERLLEEERARSSQRRVRRDAIHWASRGPNR